MYVFKFHNFFFKTSYAGWVTTVVSHNENNRESSAGLEMKIYGGKSHKV